MGLLETRYDARVDTFLSILQQANDGWTSTWSSKLVLNTQCYESVLTIKYKGKKRYEFCWSDELLMGSWSKFDSEEKPIYIIFEDNIISYYKPSPKEKEPHWRIVDTNDFNPFAMGNMERKVKND